MKKEYIAPSVELLVCRVEHGFQGSTLSQGFGGNGASAPAPDDSEWN